MIKKVQLFEARTEGYHTFRIPGILCTHQHVVLVTSEARRGLSERLRRCCCD